ncbi:hypothetical protein ACJD0Z_14345 [Flavobacteriaceae bacterium M23B6Z8]
MKKKQESFDKISKLNFKKENIASLTTQKEVKGGSQVTTCDATVGGGCTMTCATRCPLCPGEENEEANLSS